MSIPDIRPGDIITRATVVGTVLYLSATLCFRQMRVTGLSIDLVTR